jgi:hypothetical protein
MRLIINVIRNSLLIIHFQAKIHFLLKFDKKISVLEYYIFYYSRFYTLSYVFHEKHRNV